MRQQFQNAWRAARGARQLFSKRQYKERAWQSDEKTIKTGFNSDSFIILA